MCCNKHFNIMTKDHSFRCKTICKHFVHLLFYSTIHPSTFVSKKSVTIQSKIACLIEKIISFQPLQKQSTHSLILKFKMFYDFLDSFGLLHTFIIIPYLTQTFRSK